MPVQQRHETPDPTLVIRRQGDRSFRPMGRLDRPRFRFAPLRDRPRSLGGAARSRLRSESSHWSNSGATARDEEARQEVAAIQLHGHLGAIRPSASSKAERRTRSRRDRVPRPRRPGARRPGPDGDGGNGGSGAARDEPAQAPARARTGPVGCHGGGNLGARQRRDRPAGRIAWAGNDRARTCLGAARVPNVDRAKRPDPNESRHG